MKNINIVRWASWATVAIIVIVLGWYFIQQKDAVPTTVEDSRVLGNVAITIYNQDGSRATFDNVSVKNSTSLFDALKELQLRGDITLDYKDYGADLGIFIEKINGVPSDGTTGSWWQYWVNGEYGNVGASTFILNPNDVVEWRFSGARDETQTLNLETSATENEYVPQ